MKLIHEHGVLIVPGEFCGLDGYLRIGYGSKELASGLELIGAVLEESRR
jgi:aspartate/methionine/tyrosine aminotransferase